MKKLFIIIVLLINTLNFAQAKLSAYSKIFLNRFKQLEEKSLKKFSYLQMDNRLKRNFLIGEKNNQYYINAFIIVDENFNEFQLNELDIETETRVNNILTAQIPINSMNKLVKLKGIKFIEIATPAFPKLDSVRIVTRVNDVYEGINLPKGYTGEGVVIGILDYGFDYTHPMFFKDLNTSKITRVWDQNDSNGTPPNGFSYGSEYVGQSVIISKEHSTYATEESHGSHVAGIAGGTGFLTNDQFRGIAPDAELIFVELGGGNTEIADAVNYVFTYAASVNKPAVINMSLGSHIGPHDGTSTLDEVFDQLAGNGKILVGAAGNEGDTPLHLTKPANEDSIRTVVTFESDENKSGRVDIWGTSNADFSVRVSLYSASENQFQYGPLFTSSSNVSTDYYFTNNQDTLAAVSVAAISKTPNNNKPNILLDIQNSSNADVVLTIISNNEVNLWNHGTGNGAPFVDLDNSNLFVKGNTDFTAGEIGGTSKSVLTVGAYTSKRFYTDVTSKLDTISFFTEYGDIAPFSSKGPTIDLRTKPEITAPGNAVVSSFSRFDSTREDGITTQYIENNGIQWPLAAISGTSMATPVITGIVALLLQADKTLTKERIVEIFKNSAIRDNFTGNISPNGSNVWGYGKVDAYKSISGITTGIENESVIPLQYSLYQNYPNPFNPSTTIKFYLPKRDFVKLQVYDLLGKEVATLVDGELNEGVHTVNFNAAGLASGIYFYRFSNSTFTETKKMQLLK